MQVLTNTDRSVAGSAALSTQVEESVTDPPGRFSQQVTRVEVHLSDENGQRGGADDKRCLMEARLQDRPPTAVSPQASTMQLAIEGAAAKLAPRDRKHARKAAFLLNARDCHRLPPP